MLYHALVVNTREKLDHAFVVNSQETLDFALVVTVLDFLSGRLRFDSSTTTDSCGRATSTSPGRLLEQFFLIDGKGFLSTIGQIVASPGTVRSGRHSSVPHPRVLKLMRFGRHHFVQNLHEQEWWRNGRNRFRPHSHVPTSRRSSPLCGTQAPREREVDASDSACSTTALA